MKQLLCYCLLLVLSFSCQTAEEVTLQYSFWVAGHTYGKAGTNNNGFHPPFYKKTNWINKCDSIQFGVLTGDLVFKSTAEDWDEIDAHISNFEMPIHIALGNHEYKNPEIIKNRFPKTYYSFSLENDLHIILDPNIDNWNISGDQLDFLKHELHNYSKKKGNIFIYAHQVYWWNPSKFPALRINSTEGKSPKLNFETEILQLLNGKKAEVFLFAGDVGAANWSDTYFYSKIKNVNYIASGMGSGIKDNFLLVDVFSNGSVKVKTVFLEDGAIRELSNG